MLVASLVSFLAALVTLVAFAIDIALFARVRHEMNGLGISANTNAAPGSFVHLPRFQSLPPFFFWALLDEFVPF